MLKRLALVLSVLCLFAAPAWSSVEGTWDLALAPKLMITALGKPVKKDTPLPTRDQIVFSVDPEFPGTGTFKSLLFSGEWKEHNQKLKGKPTAPLIEATIRAALAQGSMNGITFGNGRLVKQDNLLTGKELPNGTIKGTFTHESSWKVEATRNGQQAQVPVKVKLLIPFSGVRASAE